MLKLSEHNTYIFSDPHAYHKNIIKSLSSWDEEHRGTLRDFKSIEHMNSVLIDGINSRVGKNDNLICLGDWSFGGFEKIGLFRNMLVCDNIHLLLGNHDHHIESDREGVRSLFSSVSHYGKLETKSLSGVRHNFVLCHFPIASWDGLKKGVMHLHGHEHFTGDKRFGNGKQMDVGIDGGEYKPYSMKEVIEFIVDRPTLSMYENSHHH